MKRFLAVGVFCSLGGLSAWAASQTLTGQISDSMCGKSHAGMGEMGKNATECTAGCVKAGRLTYRYLLDYPIPDAEIIVPEFPIPEHWPRAYGLDTRWNTVAAIWGARDPQSDVLYLDSE